MLYGGIGNDSLFSGGKSDSLYEDDDVLDGGAGTEHLEERCELGSEITSVKVPPQAANQTACCASNARCE